VKKIKVWWIATINMNDFKREYAAINKEIMPAIRRVLKSGWYVLGDEVSKFEKGGHCKETRKNCEPQNCPQTRK
jgi:hypothetical protein